MLKVGIIVSHRSIQRGRFPQSTRSMLDSAINKLNHIYKGKARIDTAFDYEGFRDLRRRVQTQDSIIERMLELNKEFDVLIFCPLVDGELGSGMTLELEAIKNANARINNAKINSDDTTSNLPAKGEIYIEAFVKNGEGVSEDDYPELMEKSNTNSPVIHWYDDDKDFYHKAYEIINTIVTPLIGKEVGGKRFPSLLAIIVLIISILFLLYAIINNRKTPSEEPTLPEAPKGLIDSAQIKFNDRIKYAEKLVIEKHYIAAGDSLNVLKSICRPEWSKEMATIDSLLRFVPSILPPSPNLSGLSPGPQPKITTTIEENTFEIVGAQSPLRGYLSNSIKEAIPGISKPSEGRKERWTITIEQDLSAIEVPKIIESDEYMIDVEYGFSVKDNQTGKTILENTLSTRGRSPASLEDAKKHSRQIAAQVIAQQVKQLIQ